METASLLNKKSSIFLAANKLGHSCFNSKAALLVLLWIFVSRLIYNLLFEPMTYLRLLPATIIPFYVYAIILCFYPAAGYLADVKYGRHKVITWSLYILCVVVSIGITVSVPFTTLFISAYVMIGQWYLIGTAAILFVPITTAFVGVNANVIQYGMDQLHDSPLDHQSLFIHWYVWVYYLSYFISQLPWAVMLQYYFEELSLDYYSSNIFKSRVMTSVYLIFILAIVILGITLTIASYRKYWFLINPVTTQVNPYKLIYKVSKFARKHKAPIHRSAFTYHEDELPTGLNLGKSKYGGPFSTEEVEDVKAFYGILKVLLTLGFTFAMYTATCPFQLFFATHVYVPYTYNGSVVDRYKNLNFAKVFFFQNNLFSTFLIIIFLPLYILVIRNSIRPYIPSMLKRIGIGIVLSFLSVTCTIAMDTAAHVNALESLSNHTNCMFTFWPNHLHQDPSELILQGFLDAASYMLITISLYEFICAQSPHYMKGFLIGLSFAVQGLSLAIIAPIDMVFFVVFNLRPLSLPSCRMLFYTMTIILGLIGLVTFAYAAKKYKYRERDEQCNYYRFAEDYYSKTQEEENF